MRQAIKDNRFQIVGYVETGRDGKQRGLNARFAIVGYFDPARNETKDSAHRIVARGNTLSALIWECRR